MRRLNAWDPQRSIDEQAGWRWVPWSVFVLAVLLLVLAALL